MSRRGWRRFLAPAQRSSAVMSSDVFARGWGRLEILTGGSPGHDHLKPFNEQTAAFRQVMNPDDPGDWLALLLLQTPQAARAQRQMDKHPHGYHDRKKRLYELIDFNDTFVSLVLLLDEPQLFNFTKKVWRMMEQFAKEYHTALFTPEQFEAITHGLSREVAVFRAAKLGGFDVLMTSRSTDAFGIDMQVYDPESGRYINVDVKTRSAFHYRLNELIHEGRLAPHEQDAAEEKGYWEVVNRQAGKHVRIILLRIDHEELGEIVNFAFVDTQILNQRLHHIVKERGLADGQFGRAIGD